MKVKVLARYVKLKRHDLPGGTVKYVRGDTFEADDHDTASVASLMSSYGPRDGSTALNKLISECSHQYEGKSKEEKKAFSPPAWYKSQLYPAIEVVG